MPMIKPMPAVKPVDFGNLEIAFAGKSTEDLTRAYWLFKAMSSNKLVNNGPVLLDVALKLHLPVIPVIRATIYKHFCGGETIEGCDKTIKELYAHSIGSVLDYSVEGAENDTNFNHTTSEIIATIHRAKGDPAIPFCVFKMTGIARFDLLEAVSSGRKLTDAEQKEFSMVRERVHHICSEAAAKNVRIFIDAKNPGSSRQLMILPMR
jgi:proline dehydrogenase